MKKILITIASVLLVTAVVSVAYSQEADDGPIVTAPPDSRALGTVSPEVAANPFPAVVRLIDQAQSVGGAPSQPIIRFQFEGAPANLDISQFRDRDFHFNELPESAQRLFIQGLPSADRNYFESLPQDQNNDFRYEPRNPGTSARPWDGLVSNWRSRKDSFSISHERRGTGHELRGLEVPKVYWVTWKRKL